LKGAHRMDKSINFLKSLNIGQNYIILGCSGGPDSMCLLDILCQMKYRIVCAHVNHNIREESKEECEFVKNFCKEKNIVFESLELPKSSNQNEAFYRKRRYDFYKSLAKRYETPYIATAHHGDDLIETVLMRIARGSQLKGYAGFSKLYKEKEYTFIKPLIFYSKEEIDDYDASNDIPFVLDSSNELDLYTRNRFRHNILPFLKSENKKIQEKFLQYSEELDEAALYIKTVVKAELDALYDGTYIDLTKFDKLDTFLGQKVLQAILKGIYEDDVDNLKLFHIKNLMSLIQKKDNFKTDLPLGFKAIREYDKLRFTKEETSNEKFMLELKNKVILPSDDMIETIEDTDDTSNFTTRLNSQDIALPLYVRTRSSGDKMEIKNMHGTKKISDIFIDSKVEPSKRDGYPIVVDSKNRIIWLPGLRKSKFDNEKNKKYDIILKYTKKGK